MRILIIVFLFLIDSLSLASAFPFWFLNPKVSEEREADDFTSWDEELLRSSVAYRLQKGENFQSIISKYAEPIKILSGASQQVMASRIGELIDELEKSPKPQEAILEYQIQLKQLLEADKMVKVEPTVKVVYLWIHCNLEKKYMIYSSVEGKKYQISAKLLGKLLRMIEDKSRHNKLDEYAYNDLKVLFGVNEPTEEPIDEHCEEMWFDYGLVLPLQGYR